LKHFILVIVTLVVAATLPLIGDDPRLIGPWKAISYTVNGTTYPMNGLVIFTKKHFSSNVVFNMTNGPVEDSNHNAGLYEADGKKLVFKEQLVQLHLRPGNPERPIELPNQPYEETRYKLEGNRLIIIFPSGNQFSLDKIKE
jgi:hypothetical protein